MNRTLRFGDRRPLEPQMDYCRLDYEFNGEPTDTLNLTIQIFDQRQTLWHQSFSNLTAHEADAIVQACLTDQWSNVLTQQFRDWAVCYLQRPKPETGRSPQIAPLPRRTSAVASVDSTVQPAPAYSRRTRLVHSSPARVTPARSAPSQTSVPRSSSRPVAERLHRRFKTRQSSPQSSPRSSPRSSPQPQPLPRSSSHSASKPQIKFRRAGARIVAAGLALGAIALGTKGIQHTVDRVQNHFSAPSEMTSHGPGGATSSRILGWLQHQRQGLNLRGFSHSPSDPSTQSPPSEWSASTPMGAIEPASQDPFQQAVTLAEQVVLEGRVADTAADWKNLAQQWHEAAQLMEQVPATDSRYELAQNRALIYHDHREQALVESALYSVVFPIHDRQQINMPESAASRDQTRASTVSSATPSSAVEAAPNQAEYPTSPLGSAPHSVTNSATNSTSRSATHSLFSLKAIATPNSCQAAAETLIHPVVSAPDYQAGQWGIYAQSITSGETLYQLNGDSFFVPASNIKIYTTAAAARWVEQTRTQADASPAPEDTSDRTASLEAIATEKAAATPDIFALIQNSNLYSNNWSAEILLDKIGGDRRVKMGLDEIGIDPTGYHMADGSGLSRSNLATPQSLVEALTAIHNSTGAKLFYDSLPVAGQRGTLKNRFYNTPAYGNVRAKTGTLMGVRSLSGYFNHSIHGRVAFGIIVNYPGHSGYGLNAPIDTIVLKLMQLSSCTPSP